MSKGNLVCAVTALLPLVGGFMPASPRILFVEKRTRGCAFRSVTPLATARCSGVSFRIAAKKGGGGGGKGFGRSGVGQGFGAGSSGGGSNDEVRTVEKTYGEAARAPIKDLIDAEAAMAEFFGSNEDWAPLFRSMVNDTAVPAMSFLGETHGGDIAFDDDSLPWRKLDPVPSGEDKIAVVASFLDSAQRGLVEIPVVEGKETDDNDVQFIEEGRRMLVLSRFQVLPGVTSGEIGHHEELFRTCWSELFELQSAGQEDTGSLILLPEYDLSDLRRFTDMNLQRPLDWLGMSDLFEVTSLQRESPAIRLIHKLSDIPDLEEND
uniref:Uncharacterized protein n=1 Tax=Odontella aurita TaxID=265563 RepID=A0A7S4N9C6_9STRA|mmetsp:Transcript_53474/g.160002  ORF Transcript_53474/g.160002 Transcript_53474/m.160002 type:complete len:321 (+) Transcript_53474:62-1024(+)